MYTVAGEKTGVSRRGETRRVGEVYKALKTTIHLYQRERERESKFRAKIAGF
jgi:hypothetical protein